jgi:hypothetical protein
MLSTFGAALQRAVEKLKEQLVEQKTVSSGLRGELRKYTDMRGKLQQQVGVTLVVSDVFTP